MLYDRVYEDLLATGSGSLLANLDELRARQERTRRYKLQHCAQAAVCLRDYRRSFGSKIMMPLQLQQAAQAISTLMKDLQQYPEQAPSSEPLLGMRAELRSDGAGGTAEHLDDEDPRMLVFAELFRALTSCAVQAMLARSVVAAVYDFAMQSQIKLPKVVGDIMSIAGSVLCHPQDGRDMGLRFPNWATRSDNASRERSLSDRGSTAARHSSPSEADQ